jgi:hypothetical protein
VNNNFLEGLGALLLSGLPVLVTFILIAGGIAVVGGYYYSRQSKQRAADLKRVAEELGFEFLPEDGGSFLSNLGRSPLFSQGMYYKRLSNLMRGQTRHLAVAIFDYQYSTDSTKTRKTLHHTVAAFQMDRPSLPPFSLRPKSVWDKIGAWMGYKDINFPQAPVFSKNYFLNGSDEMALRNLFTDQILAFFEANQGLSVETARDWLLVYRFNDRVEPWAIHMLLEDGLRVVDQLHPARAES